MAQVTGANYTANEIVDSLLNAISAVEELPYKFGGTLRGEAKTAGEMPQLVTNNTINTNTTTGEKVANITLQIPIIRTPDGTGYSDSPDLEFDDAVIPAP